MLSPGRASVDRITELVYMGSRLKRRRDWERLTGRFRGARVEEALAYLASRRPAGAAPNTRQIEAAVEAARDYSG